MSNYINDSGLWAVYPMSASCDSVSISVHYEKGYHGHTKGIYLRIRIIRADNELASLASKGNGFLLEEMNRANATSVREWSQRIFTHSRTIAGFAECEQWECIPSFIESIKFPTIIKTN